MLKEVENIFSTSNFSIKNPHSLPLSTMFAIVDSLVGYCVKLFKKARNTNGIAVTQTEEENNGTTIKSILPFLWFTLHNALPIIILLKF